MSDTSSWQKPIYQDCSDRNWDIYVARERDGESFVRIADRYGLSATRVGQIYAYVLRRETSAKEQISQGVPLDEIDLRRVNDTILSRRRDEQDWAMENPGLASLAPDMRSMLKEMFEVETDEDLALIPDRHLLMLRGITQPVLDRMRNPLPYEVRHDLQVSLDAEKKKCDGLRKEIRGLTNRLRDAHTDYVQQNVLINNLRFENMLLRDSLFQQSAETTT